MIKNDLGFLILVHKGRATMCKLRYGVDATTMTSLNVEKSGVGVTVAEEG
jgi:hypothetical protein